MNKGRKARKFVKESELSHTWLTLDPVNNMDEINPSFLGSSLHQEAGLRWFHVAGGVLG